MAIFTNQASLSYASGTANSNIVTDEVIEELSANKTAVRQNYTAGDEVSYILNIINSGTTDYTNLRIRDNLGEYFTAEGQTTVTPLDYINGTMQYFVNGTPQTGAVVEAGSPLIITGVNVPAGRNASIVYKARVNNFAPLAINGRIVNTANVLGDGITTDINPTATIFADTNPVLSITKAVNPTPVFGNGPLTYTFVISNSGNTAADESQSISLTDIFDPILNITGVTLNGAPIAVNTEYTYDQQTGNFSTVPGRITVLAATIVQNPHNGRSYDHTRHKHIDCYRNHSIKKEGVDFGSFRL